MKEKGKGKGQKGTISFTLLSLMLSMNGYCQWCVVMWSASCTFEKGMLIMATSVFVSISLCLVI